MGYTHYWTLHRTVTPDEMEAIANDARTLLSRLPATSPGLYDDVPLVIRGPFGTGTPIISAHEISFNGDLRHQGIDGDLSHESFFFTAASGFSFCKTARKPYDLLVCGCLLSIGHRLGQEAIRISSDGDNDDWLPAIEWWKSVFPDLDLPHFVSSLSRGTDDDMDE